MSKKPINNVKRAAVCLEDVDEVAAVGAAAEGVAGVPRVAAARPPPHHLLPPVVGVVQRGV